MLSKKTLLIVDDTVFNRNYLKDILNNEYQIREATNGKEALEILAENPELFSAIVLDIVMPEMDGFEFLRIQQSDPLLATIPVIVNTGKNGGIDLEIEALAKGASDFIIKPYHPVVIKHRISNIIKLRETATFIHAIERDSLTGLYKKEAFCRRAAERLNEDRQEHFVLLCADTDNFKSVNQILGEKIGDALLAFHGRVMDQLVKKRNGIACRLTSDTFSILLPLNNDLFKTVDQLILDMERTPFNISISVRIGIYKIQEKSMSINTMCDYARLAIESIKGKYDQKIALFHHKLQEKTLSKLEIESSMKESLRAEEFVVYLQPKYHLESGKMIGAEALVRWDRGALGFISPTEFVPIFENNGFIMDLDYYVWEMTCKTIRNWLDRGIELPISVNVSRVDLCSNDLPDKLEKLIKRYDIPKKLLRLEITETVYAEKFDQLISVILQLKHDGFYIEMDDFGSGYSSLNMLCSIPVDLIKLDMRFLQRGDENLKSEKIMRFIIRLGELLNIPVLAEGVETAEDVEFLKLIGCKYGQGYYYTKPIPIEQFEDLLVETSSLQCS